MAIKFTEFFNTIKKIPFPYKVLIITMRLLVIAIIVLVIKWIGFSIPPLHFYYLSTSTVGVYQDISYDKEKKIVVPEEVKFCGFKFKVTEIGKPWFNDLESITLPSSITKIESWAFDGYNNKLKEINIPEGVTYIGNYAFGDCINLKYLEIPYTVTDIGSNLFYGCHYTDVVINNSRDKVNTCYNSFKDCRSVTWAEDIIDTAHTQLKFRITSERTVEVIHNSSYKNLESIVIPDRVRINYKLYHVTKIGNHAFDGCNELTYIKIPKSIIYINEFAFMNCGIMSIDIPSSVSEISNTAFWNCNDLVDIRTSYGSKFYSEFGILYDDTMSEIIYVSKKHKGKFEIRPSITIIGDNAFFNCKELTTVKIPSSVSWIGDNAFGECKGLQNITIPSSVTQIEDKAFMGCTNLNVVIDNSKENITIEKDAFKGCKSVRFTK